MGAVVVLAFLTSIITFIALVATQGWVGLIALIPLLALGYTIFNGSMNMVQSVGRVYWIMRDNGKTGDPVIARGTMRETSGSWRTGVGLHTRIGKYSFQIGIASPPRSFDSEEEGVLYALDGRYTQNDPKEIGKWH